MRKILYLSAILTFCMGNVAAETDPVQNLVRAMVELKKTGSVCEPYLKSSPLDAMTGIDVFFTALNQPVPNPRDKAAQARLGQLIKQHAAYICSQKLLTAHNQYMNAAKLYMARKSAGWPDAPGIHFPQWCRDPACTDY
jgi:hypothetical protein